MQHDSKHNVTKGLVVEKAIVIAKTEIEGVDRSGVESIIATVWATDS